MTMTTQPEIVELSREEILRRLDHEAGRRRGLTARAFAQQYRSGTLDDPCSVADLLALVDLLADDDLLFAAA